MLLSYSSFKLCLVNIFSTLAKFLFFASLFSLAACASENQDYYDDSISLEQRLHGIWENIEQGKGDVVAQCKVLDSLARIFPKQYADYIVAANAKASMTFSEYEEWSYFLERGEEAFEEYEDHLSEALILRTKIAIKFERCRYTDSQGDMEAAIRCYKLVWEDLPSKHSDEILKSFKYVIPLSIALLNVEIGDYKNASSWLRTGRPNLSQEQTVYLGLFYNLRGRVGEMLKEEKQPERDYRRALEFYEQTEEGRTSNHLYENYVNLSDLLLEESRNEEALELLKNASQNKGITSRGLLLIHYQLSKVYLSLDALQESVNHSNLALNYSTEIKSGSYYWKGRILAVLAKSLAAQGHFELALDSMASSIQHLSFKHYEADRPALKESLTKLDLLKSLILKSSILEAYAQEQRGPKTQSMQGALESFMLSIELIKILRAGYQYDEVKEYLSAQSFPVFESALKIAFNLFEDTKDEKYLETAFSIMEISKSLSLLEKLRDTKAKESFGLPQKLLTKEAQINLRIAKGELEIKNAEEGQLNIKSKYDTLFYYRTIRENLIEDIKQKYPDYYKLKYDVSPVKIKDVKEILELDETFVEYFFGEKQVYIFSISKSETTLNAFLLTDEFNENLKTFITLSSKRRKLNTTKRIKQFNEIGYELHEKLLGRLAIGTNEMIIVADGLLNFLPFSALPTGISEEEELSALPFLIKAHVIKNNFSASVLIQQYLNKKNKDQNSKSLLVVAPKDFPNSSNLSIDSEELACIFNNDIHIERGATKKEVMGLLAQNFQNVFFLSHASVSDGEPYIQLSNDTLYLSEIYSMPISTNLVLLGACGTGLGENVRGEGVHSLARGFAYQNVPNIIMTIWEVRQDSTSPFLTDLLKYHIDDNIPLPEAMRKVQLEAIQSEQTEEPFHWAGFVIMGGMSIIN